MIPWEEQMAMLIPLLVAGTLGGLIGLERELADKPAGLRTHILVGMGSALLVVLSQRVVEAFYNPEQQQAVTGDPVRVIQAIIVGISFLGAGTIIRQGDDRIEGLTTAASILVTAAIGVSVAVRLTALAVGVTVLSLAVLWGVNRIEHAIKDRRRGEPYVPEKRRRGRARTKSGTEGGPSGPSPNDGPGVGGML